MDAAEDMPVMSLLDGPHCKCKMASALYAHLSCVCSHSASAVLDDLQGMPVRHLVSLATSVLTTYMTTEKVVAVLVQAALQAAHGKCCLCAVQCSALKRSAVRFSAVLCADKLEARQFMFYNARLQMILASGLHALQVVDGKSVCAVQCNAVQCSAMQCNAVQCSAMQCSLIKT